MCDFGNKIPEHVEYNSGFLANNRTYRQKQKERSTKGTFNFQRNHIKITFYPLYFVKALQLSLSFLRIHSISCY
jgi:hypothetical protein